MLRGSTGLSLGQSVPAHALGGLPEQIVPGATIVWRFRAFSCKLKRSA